MTKTKKSMEGSHGGEKGKSLKEQNQWQIWVIIAANSLFLFGVIKFNTINIDILGTAIKDPKNLVSVGLATVIATAVNGLINPDMKARLVFLRWNFALPGHRVFTQYALDDPRIDMSALENWNGGPLPKDPKEQNQVWYRLYKTIDHDPAVIQAHRAFLLLRDYTGLSVIFFILFGTVGFYEIPSIKIGALYLVVLAFQYIVVRKSASNYGIRFVTTVLARGSAKEEFAQTKPPRKKE